LIKYVSGSGRTPTQYTMLGTCLLPELRVLKIKTLPQSTRSYQGLKNYDTLYTIKEREKKRAGIFKGMSSRDRALLREKGIVIARSSRVTEATTQSHEGGLL